MYICTNNFSGHYIEYLIGLIITNKIDPVEIMSLIECQCEIERNCLKLPPKGITDTDETYLNACKMVNITN